MSDEFTVPLCRMHHREIHRSVKEQHWWSRVGIDPIPIADKLWAQTHPSVSKSPEPIQADTLSARRLWPHDIVQTNRSQSPATFEEAIAASFDPETAVKRELILRLASLPWRLRRATSIETALFQVKIEDDSGPQAVSELSPSPSRLAGIHVPACIRPSDDVGVIPTNTLRMRMQENRIALAWCFPRVINLTDDAFERLGRYEATLWRQVRQTLFSLEGLRLGRSAKRYRRSHYQKTLVTNSVQVRVKRPNRIRHKRGAALSSKAHLRCYLGSWSLVLL